MHEDSITTQDALTDHERELLLFHKLNLGDLEHQLFELTRSDQLIPTIVIHRTRAAQSEINKIYAKKGLPLKYEISSPTINPEKKSYRDGLTNEKIQQAEQLLSIHHLNVAHYTSEHERLKARGVDVVPVENMINRELSKIASLELTIYS